MPSEQKRNKDVELDLYFDESGRFDEPSPAEAAEATTPPEKNKDPSQIVGLLVPQGALDEEKAGDILGTAHRLAGLPMKEQVHATEIRDNHAYDILISGLADQIARQRWQPVRLVNRTGLGFGDHAETYTRMVAELVLRVFDTESRKKAERIGLRLIPARVKTGESDGAPETIAPQEYEQRLREGIALSAVRRGVSAGASGWQIESLRLLSGKYRRELQICDLLSNASYRNFRRTSPETTRRLRELFGAYDFTFSFLAAADEARRLLDLGAVGLAVRFLGEFFLESDTTDQARKETGSLLDEAVDRLASMDAPARNTHLAEIIAWIAQLVEGQRVLDTSAELLEWLRRDVVGEILDRLDDAHKPTIDWFSLALGRWALTVHNHRGALEAGQTECRRIDVLLPRVAGRWEHADLLLEALVAQSVHFTDSFDHQAVRSRLKTVSENYGALSQMLGDALPDLFPERIRSDLQGQVLGTWLQAETYAGAEDPACLEVARELSDRAMEEFSDPADVSRQQQYRSQLEATAGDFQAARTWLARSLDLAEDSHDALGRRIAGLRGIGQGFALLHWSRIGRLTAEAGLVGASESADFTTSIRRHGLLTSDWVTAAGLDYPAHGIRRSIAASFAANGKKGTGDARTRLTALRDLGAIRHGRFVLTLIELAAMAEVACLSWEADTRGARSLLDRRDELTPGLLQSIALVQRRFPDLSEVFARTIAPWPDVARRVLQDEANAREELVHLARRIGY